MLHKSDHYATGPVHRFRRLWMVAAAATILCGAEQQEAESEMQYEAAVHREIVVGDLKGALEQYRTLLAQPAASRDFAARVLFRSGQCFERLGRRSEARASYARVVNEFGDQPSAAAARERLAQWESAAAGPRNIDFKEGVPGKVPPGWFVLALPKDENSFAELRRDGCRSKSGCAVVMVPANAPSRVSHLMQSFSATAYRGKTVRLRAWLRLEQVDPADRGQLFFKVERGSRQPGFFDNMEDRPVRSGEWTLCDIEGRIDEDATFIELGVLSAGRGRVWVDDVSFEVVGR